MDRMKTFLIYVLVLVGFFLLSNVLENRALLSMYSTISGEIDCFYEGTESDFDIQNFNAKSCNINGYMSFDFVNTTGKHIDKCYIKINLYDQQDLLAHTEYVEINDMKPDESRKINIKFNANHIKRYDISVVQNIPDKTNILNILGWEIDLTNVGGLGIDLTKVKIFGKNIGEFIKNVFDKDKIKSTGNKFLDWALPKVRIFTTWPYVLAALLLIL